MLTNQDTLPSVDRSWEEAILPLSRYRPAPPVVHAPVRHPYLPVRRLLDVVCTVVLCLIAAPIVLLAAIAIRLTSRGPAFYSQVRVGLGGRAFTIYKLRTMIHNCESLTGPRWTIPDDPRVTPVGWLLRRTHIDELPQLLNVLAGDMSLVGPRPERPEFVAELQEALPSYLQRHAVLPGITGLAQVQLAPDTDLESVRQKLRYDLHFVRHLSFCLDVRIMLATALHMVGMSFATLQRLRVVPTPGEAMQATVPMESLPLVRKQAA